MHPTVLEQSPKAAARLPMTPARRVALAIGVPVCLLATATTGFSLVANVGRGTIPVSYQIPAGASRVHVTTSGGNVQLQQAAGRGSLTGTGFYSLVRPHLTDSFAAGTAAFGYRCSVIIGNCGLNATLAVPAGTAVTVSTDGGNFTAADITGNVDLSTGGGDVSADRMSGVLFFSTGGGNIQATKLDSIDVTADTGGGDIEITFTTVPRDVQVHTGGGNITIVVPGNATYHVEPTTGGGNIHDSVHKDDSSPNLITATSGGGDITISPSA